jgi:hypothetical protein
LTALEQALVSLNQLFNGFLDPEATDIFQSSIAL